VVAVSDLTPTAEAAKYGLLDVDAEPNNLDEYEPGGDPEDDECGSWFWHEQAEERLAIANDPREGLIVCGTCHPELLAGGCGE
jgi:hypothetical protein